VRLSKALLDTALEDHAPASNARAATITNVAIQAVAQPTPAAADASQIAKLAAGVLLDPTAEADMGKILDCVVEGLRAMEGLDEGRLVGHASKGFASADFASLVERTVKIKLEAEVRGLIRARLVGKTAPQDEIDCFMENAAATVEVAMGIVYRVMKERWRAVARFDEAGRENYVHVFEKLPRGLKVLKREKVHFLRYEVGYVTYGDAKAEEVVVLVLLAGEKSIRVEVLAKSVVYVPARLEEVEWGGERWVRLATAWINKPSGAKNYVAQVEPRLVKATADVGRDAAGVDCLRGLLVTDASGKEIRTSDPLLVKLFASNFKKVEFDAAGVSRTEAGFALHFRAVARDDESFKELFGDIAERYGKSLEEVVRKAKDMWLETMRMLSAGIIQVADEATEVKRGEGVEAGRRALVEGLRRLFEEKEWEALNAGRLDDALAIAVAGRLLLGIVNSPKEWFSLLVGDGVVDVTHKTLGFSAKYTEVAKAVLHLLAVWAGAYGAVARVINEREVVFASPEDAAKVLRAILVGEVLEYAMSLAMSWSRLAGSNAPKLISLLALAQLLGVIKGRWAVELWLAHKAATTPVKPEVAKVLNGLLARVESVDKDKWTERGVSLYFKLRDVENATRVAVFRLYTDFHDFHLHCESCNETTVGRILGAVAEKLRPAVEQMRRRLGLAAEGQEWPKWEGNALELPAGVGWSMFLKLWERYSMSLPVVESGLEVLRVEVLDARPDGSAKFRLWFDKWRESRPHQPYVDFEIRPYQRKDGVRFRGYVYANETEGILRDHLAEIAELLRDKEVRGVSLTMQGKVLQFTGAFRDSVLSRLGVAPERPRAEPIAVEHLRGYRFKIGDKEVEFGEKVIGARWEFYTELKMPSAEEAVNFTAALRAVGVDSKVVGNIVKLNSDSFFGLLAAANAAPSGLTLLYRSNDLHVYAAVEGGRMRFYFAARHEGVWKAVGGLYNENLKGIMLIRAEHEVLETVRNAVTKALEKLGRPADVGEPREIKDKEGNVKAYRLYLYTYHLVPFMEHAAAGVRAKPAEVRLEGRHIAVRAGAIATEVEFKLLKFGKAEYFLAQNVGQTFALYKSLKAVGVPVEITPKGVEVDGETIWTLVAAAVERSAPSVLPIEVMPGVELLRVYNVDGMKLYAFRAEGAHYYFTMKAEEGWRVAGGKLSSGVVQIAGEAARAVADAINALYRETGIERIVEVRYYKDGVPYIKLTNVDLGLLSLKRP